MDGGSYESDCSEPYLNDRSDDNGQAFYASDVCLIILGRGVRGTWILVHAPGLYPTGPQIPPGLSCGKGQGPKSSIYHADCLQNTCCGLPLCLFSDRLCRACTSHRPRAISLFFWLSHSPLPFSAFILGQVASSIHIQGAHTLGTSLRLLSHCHHPGPCPGPSCTAWLHCPLQSSDGYSYSGLL